MIKQVYVDGQHGTTGLEIQGHIAKHPNLELMSIPFEQRHDKALRKQMLNTCDIAILCLPDDGSREAVSMIENEDVIVIDTSTAFRVDDSWCYGLPELSATQRETLKTAKRIANPGCHASAAILLLKPLLEAGYITPDSALKLFSITGYTGGGKSMIAEFEAGETLPPRQYALTLNHKHMPEVMKHLGLKHKPMFMPVVGAYARGIVLTLPLEFDELVRSATQASLTACYQDYYKESEFAVIGDGTKTILETSTKAYGNRFDIEIFGNDTQCLLTLKLDNLGKGASGAAIQTINLMYDWPSDLGI